MKYSFVPEASIARETFGEGAESSTKRKAEESREDIDDTDSPLNKKTKADPQGADECGTTVAADSSSSMPPAQTSAAVDDTDSLSEDEKTLAEAMPSPHTESSHDTAAGDTITPAQAPPGRSLEQRLLILETRVLSLVKERSRVPELEKEILGLRRSQEAVRKRVPELEKEIEKLRNSVPISKDEKLDLHLDLQALRVVDIPLVRAKVAEVETQSNAVKTKVESFANVQDAALERIASLERSNLRLREYNDQLKYDIGAIYNRLAALEALGEPAPRSIEYDESD